MQNSLSVSQQSFDATSSVASYQRSFASEEQLPIRCQEGAVVIAEEPQEGDEPNIDRCMICMGFLSGRTVSFCSQGHNMHAEPCADLLIKGFLSDYLQEHPHDARTLSERRTLVIPGKCATCRESLTMSVIVDVVDTEQHALSVPDTRFCEDLHPCERRCLIMCTLGCCIGGAMVGGATLPYVFSNYHLDSVIAITSLIIGVPLIVIGPCGRTLLSSLCDDPCCVAWQGCRLRASSAQNPYEEIRSDTAGHSDFTDTGERSEFTPIVTQPQSAYGAFNVAYHNLLHPEASREEPTPIVCAPLSGN